MFFFKIISFIPSYNKTIKTLLEHIVDPITQAPFFKPVMGSCFHSVSQSASGENDCPHCRVDWKDTPKKPDTLLDKLTCELIIPHIQNTFPSIISDIFKNSSENSSLEFTARDSGITRRKWQEGALKLDKKARSFLPISRSPVLTEQAFLRIYNKLKTKTDSLLYVENIPLPPHLYQVQTLLSDCLEKEPHHRFLLAKSDWNLAESQIKSNPEDAIETYKKVLDTCYLCLIALNIQQIEGQEIIMDKLVYDVIDVAISTHSKLVYLLPEFLEKKQHITQALNINTFGTDLLTKCENDALSPEKLAQITSTLKNNSDWCHDTLKSLHLSTDYTFVKSLSEETQLLRIQALFTTYSSEKSFQTKSIADSLRGVLN